MLRRVSAGRRERELFLLGAVFLAGDQGSVLCQAVLCPLARKRRIRRGGDDHHVDLPGHDLERLAHKRKRRDVLDDLFNRSIDRLAPLERRARSASPVAATAAFKAGLASLVSRSAQARKPPSAGSRGRRTSTSGRSAKQVDRHDQPRKAVDPPPLRVEIDKLGRFAGVLRDRRQLDNT